MLAALLEHMRTHKADSLQIRTGHAPYMFRDGESIQVREQTLSAQEMEQIAGQILSPAEKTHLTHAGRLDRELVSEKYGTFDLRVRALPEGLAVALRPVRPAAQLDSPVRTRAVSPAPTQQETKRESTKDASMKQKSGPVFKDKTLDGILRTVLEHQISDLVVSSGKPARVRIGGQYQPIPSAIFNAKDILDILSPVITPARRAVLNESGSLDVAFELKDAQGTIRRFRVNVFHHLDGLAAAWRPIWDEIPQLESLMLPPSILDLASLPYGLILVTGPTGSGKSTTLSALIEYINRKKKRHIITLEDPIEFRFSDHESVIHQREVGVHVDSFSKGLRAALREAPDVILVGEMRDLDTIQAALTAAETGHLVLSTLHSGTSAQAVDRIIDVFPEHQQQQVRSQLADVLQAIVAQRLLPTIDNQSRVPAVELVRVNYAVSNTIREHRTHQFNMQIQSGAKDGMIPFDVSLAQLVNQGLVEREVAMRCARDLSHFKGLLKS